MSVNSIELKDLQSLQSRVLFSGTGVADSLCWLPDDRLVYNLAVGVAAADWSADGKSFFVTTMDSERKSALFNVKLDGSNSLLLKDDKDSIEWVVPSPDGKLAAINKYTGITNVWSLTNF